jgi:hypothetical protein
MVRMLPRCLPSIQAVVLAAAWLVAPTTGAAEDAPQASSIRVTLAFEGEAVRVVSARESLESFDSRTSLSGTDVSVEAIGSTPHTTAIADPRRRHADYLAADGSPTGRIVEQGRGYAVVQVALGTQSLRVQAPGLDTTASLPAPTSLPGLGDAPRAAGECEVHTLRDSGPSDSRQDIVFLAEGYLEGDLQPFLSDVDRVLDRLNSFEPYSRYSSFVNVHAVFVASAEAGADHPEAEPATEVDTALNCSYGAFGVDRILGCDAQAVLALAGEAPGDDVRMVLVNDEAYGGSGGQDYAVTFTGPLMEPVAAHELGHTDAFLADEYHSDATWPGGGPDYANCSRFSNQQGWQEWIDAATPDVGSFTGCTFRDWYRPTREGCLMNVLEADYCVVCREQVVRSIHAHIPALIEAKSPDISDYIPLTALSEVTLSVDVIEPVDEPLYVTWSWVERDEILAEGAGLDTLEVGALDLADGPWTIEALVEDRTPWVLSDPFRLMEDRAVFFVNVSPTGDDDDDDTTEDGDGCGCSGGESAAALPLLAALGFRRRLT